MARRLVRRAWIAIVAMVVLAGCQQPTPPTPAEPVQEPVFAHFDVAPAPTPWGETMRFTSEACEGLDWGIPARLVALDRLGIRTLDWDGNQYVEGPRTPLVARMVAPWGDAWLSLEPGKVVRRDGGTFAVEAEVQAPRTGAAAVHGDFAVVSSPGKLEVWDASLSPIGSVDLPTGPNGTTTAHRLLVHDDHVYVLDNLDEPIDAFIVNVADPTHPSLVARATFEGQELGMQWVRDGIWTVVATRDVPGGAVQTWFALNATTGEVLAEHVAHATWRAEDGSMQEAGQSMLYHPPTSDWAVLHGETLNGTPVAGAVAGRLRTDASGTAVSCAVELDPFTRWGVAQPVPGATALLQDLDLLIVDGGGVAHRQTMSRQTVAIHPAPPN